MTISLEVKDIAPDFSLSGNNGFKFSLSNLKGKKVLIYFYPKDDTTGCTLEAKEFSDKIDEFASHNCEIYGISKDSIQSHEKFIDKQCLRVTLLSDSDSNVCENYGVYIEKKMFGKNYMGIQRTTFLVNEIGIIEKKWSNVNPVGHVAEVLKTIKNL